jgi:transposase
MATAGTTFSDWLAQAHIPEERLTPDQRAVLLAAFTFRQEQGDDYYSTRILSHFLLHASTGLKVAQIARLLGLSRPTASRQQGLSSKQTVQQAHHRMDGRPYGKLLPRFAGPIAGFLCAHPDASRADLLDFIDDTFGVRVSRIALYKFLKKFGLDQIPPVSPVPAPVPIDAAGPLPPTLPATPRSAASAPPFCSDPRTTRALS